MKLNNKQIGNLEDTLYHLERAMAFINKQTTIVGIKSNSNTLDLFNNDREDYKIQLINKEYGSHLTGLSMGIERLKMFIDFYSQNK